MDNDIQSGDNLVEGLSDVKMVIFSIPKMFVTAKARAKNEQPENL